MAYEPGSYLKELKQDHADGDHDESRHDMCPSCADIVDEEQARKDGCASADAYRQWVAEQCNQPDPELENEIAEVFKTQHAAEEHRRYPNRNCPACVQIHGANNI